MRNHRPQLRRSPQAPISSQTFSGSFGPGAGKRDCCWRRVPTHRRAYASVRAGPASGDKRVSHRHSDARFHGRMPTGRTLASRCRPGPRAPRPRLCCRPAGVVTAAATGRVLCHEGTRPVSATQTIAFAWMQAPGAGRARSRSLLHCRVRREVARIERTTLDWRLGR